MAEIGASIEEALEAVAMVSKVSKGLKGTMVDRLKTAIAIIRSGTDEMLKRQRIPDRPAREPGANEAIVEELRKKVTVAGRNKRVRTWRGRGRSVLPTLRSLRSALPLRYRWTWR